MSTTKRGVAYNGTQIKISKPAEGLSQSIGIIAADGTVTDEAHNMQSGDVVFIDSVSNPAAKGFFPVSVVDNTKYKIVGLESKELGQIDDATYVAVETFNYCDATSLKITPATVDFEDATTNCDDYPYEEGTVSAGSISMDMLWDGDKDIVKYLENLMFDQTDTVFQFKPKGKLTMRSFVCSVSSWEYSGEANGKYSGSVELKIKSKPMDILLKA